jgi:hypothetical protein
LRLADTESVKLAGEERIAHGSQAVIETDREPHLTDGEAKH